MKATPSAIRPAATRVYPTLKAWLSEETTQQHLASLIVDPVFTAFCHYLSEGMRVQPEDLTGPKALLPREIDRKAAMHAGACQFIPTVKKLLAVKTENNKPPEAWAYLQPDNQ
jgi:hypothetical protein